MIYLLGNAPVQAWLKSPDLRRETCGSLVLYLPPSSKRDVLILAMKDIDERLAAAKNFKHGQKTRAAFITLPDGSECFGKSVQIAKMRLENRFRYVVAPTRGLWAAAVAQRLREIGVPTPEVWGAGERRPRLFPTVSYLFTEILRVTQLDVWLRNSDALMDEAERILPRLGRMIGRLHGGRITHNDLKPENVYLSADEEPGLCWTRQKSTAIPSHTKLEPSSSAASTQECLLQPPSILRPRTSSSGLTGCSRASSERPNRGSTPPSAEAFSAR